jgi:hypothetical protein
MFKITASGNGTQTTLILEGNLADPGLSELERAWNDAKLKGTGQVVVEMKDVTAISERAKALLHEMSHEGAKFNCPRGVLTKHLVRRLAACFENCQANRGRK